MSSESPTAHPSGRIDYVRLALDAARNDPDALQPAAAAPRRISETMPLSRILIFLTVVLGITGSLHYYLWARLVRDTALPSPWGAIATIAIAILALLMPLGMLFTRFARRSIASPISWVVFTWMGAAFFLLVLLAPADIARGVWSWFQDGAIDPEKRRFLARAVGAAVGFGAFGIAGTALFSALRPVAVKRVDVGLAKLPESMNGFTIVQLSDIHVGPTIGKQFVDDMVARANALEPDLVAITGDLVDGSVAELGHLTEGLRNLRARHGVYFVTGNHEYYSGVDEWIDHLRSLGVRVLRNERIAIGGEGADGFDLAGVDDYHAHQFGNGHGMRFDRIVEGRDPSRALVLLAHQPKAIEAGEPHGVDLQLSGHTHGGQMYPFNYLVKLQQPYVAGLYRHGRAQVYVSRGTGYWGPPMRLAAPAEITQIRLVRAPA
jgi:predicted MPP superfamily phosphohydrolase